MLEAHGLLQLTMRSESYRSRAQQLSRNNSPHATGKPDNPATTGGSGPAKAKSAITLPKGAESGPLKEFWQKAAEKAAQAAPSAETMQKLQEAGKDDNKEIAAQKMQQAKAKLQSLRMQAQLAAASGDKQQLRRLAQEVAAAARDVAAAVRDLAGGIVSAIDTDSGGAAIPLATAGSAAGTAGTEGSDGAQRAADQDVGAQAAGATATTDTSGMLTSDATSGGAGLDAQPTHAGPAEDQPLYAQAAPETGDKLASGEKALNSLSTDANNAIAQARGLLAFLATAAHGKRRRNEGNDDDRFFSELQRLVDDAQGAVNQSLADASRALAAEASDVTTTLDGGGSLFGLENVSVSQVTITTVTTTALFVNITT